jgi:uncharacterized membrane protein YsdA (DUF1294 family)
MPFILGAIILINTWTFMMFGFDKLRAEAGSWRIRESTLLTFAFLGGSLGACAGRSFFRHKTRKQRFASSLNRIVIGHLLVIAVGVGLIV